MAVTFMKMHGLGNDFVVLDARNRGVTLSNAQITSIADRHRGVGFDQLAVIDKKDDLPHLTFYNSDGSRSATCGNATRCVAQHLMSETGQTELAITTDHGTLFARDGGNGLISVNMGAPVMDWQSIPLAQKVDTLHLPIEGEPTATGMGNPHCTFFVADAEAVDLSARGAEMERHALFPEATNVQFASLVGTDHLRMRVWERGVGVTLASGSSSCAVAVAAHRRGLTGRAVKLTLDGGDIWIDWRDDGVWMTGPTMHVFTGTFTGAFLDAAK